MSRWLARLLPLAALALLLLTPAARAQPNVVVVMTDDQALSQMRALPKTKALIGGAGVKFERSYTAQPKCCPNRATFLTGQYPHNHGVRDNEPPNGGYSKLDHSETLPVWLDRAGYETAFIGKYMNGYNRVGDIPPGWDEWAALIDFGYYNFTLNDDGESVSYGSSPADYQTDVLADRAADFIDRSAPAADPFFLWIAPQAPHIAGVRSDIGEPDNPQSAPRHQGDFKGAIAPRTPNYNERDVSDKPRYIRRQRLLSRQQKTKIDTHFRSTLESLSAVDDMVQRLRNRLHASGELADTLFVFTSDNGYFFGNHRSFCCKDEIYEEAARVPLLVRGPGFPRGVVRNQLVSTVDLAPTILQLGDATPGRVVDGRSLLVPARRAGAGAGRDLLVETFNHRFFAVRSGRWKYARNQSTGEEQLFNIATDPRELESLHADRRYRDVKLRLRQKLAQLKVCAGASCR
ncbi:sulfatase [soil metagenome]